MDEEGGSAVRWWLRRLLPAVGMARVRGGVTSLYSGWSASHLDRASVLKIGILSQLILRQEIQAYIYQFGLKPVFFSGKTVSTLKQLNSMQTKHLFLGIALLAVVLTLASCAPIGMSEQRYGFLYGILHGWLLYAAVISKVLGMDFDIYAHNNTGLWYWVGYALGVFSIGGGIFSSRRR